VDDSEASWFRRALRRIAGWLWAGLWFFLLWRLTAPWDELGGVVHERLRWLIRVALWMGLIVGIAVGHWSRLAARPCTGRSHAGLLRWILLPQATLAALILIALQMMGREAAIGMIATGFFAYWAGLDLGIGAWPLMHGRHYRFNGPIDAQGSGLAL
jgi:hypothetical protein